MLCDTYPNIHIQSWNKNNIYNKVSVKMLFKRVYIFTKNIFIMYWLITVYLVNFIFHFRLITNEVHIVPISGDNDVTEK